MGLLPNGEQVERQHVMQLECRMARWEQNSCFTACRTPLKAGSGHFVRLIQRRKVCCRTACARAAQPQGPNLAESPDSAQDRQSAEQDRELAQTINPNQCRRSPEDKVARRQRRSRFALLQAGRPAQAVNSRQSPCGRRSSSGRHNLSDSHAAWRSES